MRTRRATGEERPRSRQTGRAVAACPYKEGDIVSGWDRDGTSPAKVDKILFVPSYPYYDLRVLPITEGANHPDGTGTPTTCWM